MAESVYLDLRNIFSYAFYSPATVRLRREGGGDKSYRWTVDIRLGLSIGRCRSSLVYANGMSRDKREVGQGLLVGLFVFTTRAVLFLELFPSLSRRQRIKY